MQVAGRRVLITGAAGGLGLATATAFARAGAALVLTDLNAEAVERAVSLLREQGASVAGYKLDVTNPEDVLAVRARVLAEHGTIDVLVNNAGVLFGGAFADVPLARHLTTVNVNLVGVFAVTHAFLPDLLARPEAHIVNLASASAVIALPFGVSYAATKWAVLGFSDSLREELRFLGHRHVGVTAVCPSYIATTLVAGARPPTFTRLLTPETVARAIVSAVERKRELVMLPWSVRALHTVAGFLPRGLYRAACRALGVSRSMTGWHGAGTRPAPAAE